MPIKKTKKDSLVWIHTASCRRSSFPDFASCRYFWPSEPRHSTTFGAFIPFIILRISPTWRKSQGENINNQLSNIKKEKLEWFICLRHTWLNLPILWSGGRSPHDIGNYDLLGKWMSLQVPEDPMPIQSFKI